MLKYVKVDGYVHGFDLIIMTTSHSFNQLRLINVQYIQATSLAFAALRSNGTVVTWGTPHAGGDSGSVQDQLKDVMLGMQGVAGDHIRPDLFDVNKFQ